MTATKWVQVAPRIERLDCTSVDEFAEVLDPGADHSGWLPAFRRHRWIFRGHADASWSLTPSAWRHPPPSTIERAKCEMGGRIGPLDAVAAWDHTGVLPPLPSPDLIIARELISQANAEMMLVAAFGYRADELGLWPTGTLPMELHGQGVFEGQRPTAADDFLQVGEVEHPAAIAHHHGIPTRLLDWTDDPRIAAFFAAVGQSPGERLGVWAIDERLATWKSRSAVGAGRLSLRFIRPRDPPTRICALSAARSRSLGAPAVMRC